MKKTLTLATALILLASCAPKEQYYEKQLTFPEGSTLEEKVEMAARLVPTKSQLEWQKLEMTAFLHFGMNTFTGQEWGDGQEDPALFNPTDLDTEQWVRTLQQAGFKMVILTAKHHDGFCLWPTATTTHSVASSPWKDGKGDVVRELRDACEKYGMKFGFYLSPWDRHAPCYGDSPEYNKYFVAQLTELLTNYGKVDEVWFDGANGEGPNGRKQVYDWDAIYSTIRSIQPDVVTAIMGDDVRWVGNESGLGRETEWSATVFAPDAQGRGVEINKTLGINSQSKDLGTRAMLEKAQDLFWYPSEVDVSIRPGWFYHAEEDTQVKSLSHLADIYYQSVGYNSVLLLNIPPVRRGHIHEADSVRLQEFAGYLQETFGKDFVLGGDAQWDAASGDEREWRLAEGSRVNVLMLQEDMSRGQRVESFTVEGLTADGWTTLCEGTTVGHKRLLRIPETEISSLRVRITSARSTAHICRVGAFQAPEIQ